MDKLTSRKLVGAVAAMLTIAGLVVGGTVAGAETNVVLSAIGVVGGLGGFQVMRQARIDEAKDQPHSLFVPGGPTSDPRNWADVQEELVRHGG